MKLHLPVALLTAVISAMSYGAEPAYIIDRTMGSDMQSGTYNDNDVIVNVTGGDFAKYNMGGTPDEAAAGWLNRADYGAIQGASATDVMPREHDSELIPVYGDIYLNVSGGENISYLIGEGVPTPVKVTGDKYINVTGGDIDTIVGGVHYRSKSNGFTGVGNATNTGAGDANWAYKDASDPDINISVTGGTVGQIRGGNNNSSSNVYNSLKYALGQGKDLMTDKPWAVAGDVNISVGGDAVVGDGTKAIAGAGGSGHSVDGKVTVNVSGGTINGAIYGGSTNIYTEVGSTEVNISGGTINGNVYGGGNYDDGAKKAADFGLDPAVGPTVKGGSTVVLSGGTINGSVYAAGDKDIVNGGTNVVIKNGGTKVTGTISGMGVDSEVNGEGILTIENSGGLNVGWDQFKGFNSLKIDSSQINFGTLSDDFKTVTTTGTGTHVQGTIAHDVLLKSDGSWLQLDGSLSTTAGSYITNTMAGHNMSVKENATFAGTSIGNSTINVGKTVTIKEKSEVTGSTLTAGTDVTVSGSTVTGSTLTATTGDITVGDSTVAGSTLTADKNVTVSGSAVTGSTLTATTGNVSVSDSKVSDTDLLATNGNVSVSGSKVSDTDLLATNGNVTISASSYTNTGGADYIKGSTVKIEDTNIESKKDTIFVKGDTTVENGDFLLNGGSVSFSNNVTTDKDSSFVVNKGTLSFGDSTNKDDLVTLNGTAVENNGGTIHAYGQVKATDASITATAGATHFHNVVEANGTSITAQGGAAMHFDEKVVLDGSRVTTLIDSSNSQGVIKFHNDVEASGTIFEVIGGSGLTFEGDVVLNGENKFIVNPGEKGYYNRNFSFLGDTVTANGTNLINGGVTMGANTVLTANGELYINANGGSSSSAPTSTLTNLQMGENGKINVTATLGYLKMTGNASITNLNLNGVWGSTISGKVNVADKVTITDKGNDSLDITSTGSLKTSKFDSTSGVITNSGSLTVNNSTTLADSTLINKKGTTTLKGEVSAIKSDLVSTGGEINITGTVHSKDSTFYAHGGNINFRNESDKALWAEGGSFIVDKGVVRFGGQTNHKGLVAANGATFEAIKNSYSDNSVMYFHSAVEAVNGTEISAKGGTMYFERELNVQGSTITSGKSEAGIAGKIYLKDDVVAQDTKFIIDGGSDISFEGNVELNGGNTLAVTDGNSKYFTFAGEKVTVKGDNTISGGLTMGKNTVLTAQSGVLTIESAPKIKENGSYNPQNLRLNNLQIAENAAEGTEINVTANRGQLSIGGDSTVTNLSIDRATTELSGNLNVGGMEIHSTRNQYGVVGTVDFKGAEGTKTNIGIMKVTLGTDGEMTHSGDGTVNVGHMLSDMPAPSVPESAINYEIKQTGNGTMNFDGWWATGGSSIKMSQTGQGNINIKSIGANIDSMTQSGGGTVTVDSVAAHIGSLDVAEGSTFENLCSVSLNDVAISDATLFNAGSMSMDSLVMDNATLLFAASSLTDASSMIQFNGADLTGYGTNNVSAADMIKEFGVVMSGDAAEGLLKQWGSEVEFSFTLAKGSDLFEEHFAYVLDLNKNEFTITLGDVAELSFADGEIKNITVEDTENGVVVKGTAVIPEPTTATLSLLALAALAARRRRR